MTVLDLERNLKLVDASRKIATIYAQCGAVEAAQQELLGLGKSLREKGAK